MNTVRVKHSVLDSAAHHMHSFQKYAHLASATREGSKAIGFAQKAAAHRRAANLIFAFVDSKRVAK